MKDLDRHWQSELARNVRAAAVEIGPQATRVPGVSVLRYEAPVPWRRNRWTASVGLIVQGKKEIEVADSVFRFPAGSFIASPLDLPVRNRIVAAPFLVLTVRLDPLLMKDLPIETARPRGELPFAVGGKAGPALIEAFARLSRLLVGPTSPAGLSPILVREIYCHLLAGPEGAAIRQFLDHGTTMEKMTRAVAGMHAALAEKLDVDALAKSAHMSRSVFFESFRLATRMSPIQYQKQIRLLEARRLLADTGATVESASFAVGYKSASQFSREYARYFGSPPKRDLAKRA